MNLVNIFKVDFINLLRKGYPIALAGDLLILILIFYFANSGNLNIGLVYIAGILIIQKNDQIFFDQIHECGYLEQLIVAKSTLESILLTRLIAILFFNILIILPITIFIANFLINYKTDINFIFILLITNFISTIITHTTSSVMIGQKYIGNFLSFIIDLPLIIPIIILGINSLTDSSGIFILIVVILFLAPLNILISTQAVRLNAS